MKKTIIGGLLAFLGSIWALVIISVAGNNLVNSWNLYLGRLYSTVSEYQLMFPFVLSVIVAVLGLGLLVAEYFRTEEQVTAQPAADESPWICSKCGASNPKSKVQCHSCGTMRS